MVMVLSQKYLQNEIHPNSFFSFDGQRCNLKYFYPWSQHIRATLALKLAIWISEFDRFDTVYGTTNAPRITPFSAPLPTRTSPGGERLPEPEIQQTIA